MERASAAAAAAAVATVTLSAAAAATRFVCLIRTAAMSCSRCLRVQECVARANEKCANAHDERHGFRIRLDVLIYVRIHSTICVLCVRHN